MMGQATFNYQEEYFFSLVTLTHGQKKMRKCLKCSTEFESRHYGHRVCAVCEIANRRVGERGRSALSSV
ncbi:MAG: hypothetical protein HQL32_00100 [Planctomycetes bacterium]|nr:hypothetical protein [Planctomycetota bacterium]